MECTTQNYLNIQLSLLRLCLGGKDGFWVRFIAALTSCPNAFRGSLPPRGNAGVYRASP
jgi:hypothetical protein